MHIYRYGAFKQNPIFAISTDITAWVEQLSLKLTNVVDSYNFSMPIYRKPTRKSSNMVVEIFHLHPIDRYHSTGRKDESETHKCTI